MANRRPQTGGGGRRMDFRNDRGKNFARSGVSPWQGGGPGPGLPNLLPLSGGSTEATLALASNIINLLQPRQNPVPSLLDMPIRRDFGPNMGRLDRGYPPNRMGNQGNFRRTGNYNRAGERINTSNRKPFRPSDGQRQQNKSSPKKEADSKAKPVKESEQEESKNQETTESTDTKEQKEDEKKKEGPRTRYDDINPQLLMCHICNKSMWDGRSFENHLSGRAHAIMMQKTAESYALTADTMRQEFKIREMKRTRKTGQQPARDFYCAMCDMYAGDGAIHRTTVGHRKLKKYLHPTCTSCHKEMPTRFELDEHRLTPEHLRVMQDKQEIISKPKPEVMVISTLNMEQLYLREDRQRRRRRAPGSGPAGPAADNADNNDRDDEKAEGDNQDQQGETTIKKENEDEEGEKQEQSEDKKDNDLDADNTLLDYKEGDDLAGVSQDQFPAYSTKRGVGRSFLSEFRCVECRLCRKLLDSDETAEVHLRTWRHHQLFLRLITDKSGANKQTQETKKRPHDADECDNWKRRKTSQDNDDNDDDADQNGHLDNTNENIKGEVNTVEEPDIEAELEGDTEMPMADELEDWDEADQTIDEGDHTVDDSAVQQNNEQDAEAAEIKTEPEPIVEQEVKEPEKEKSPPPNKPIVENKPQPSPRGRGRGRGRGRARGRY